MLFVNEGFVEVVKETWLQELQLALIVHHIIR